MKNLWNPVRFFKQHRKGTLIMGNFLIMLMFFTFNVSASLMSQKVTIEVEDVSLKDCLKAIEKQTELGFLYNSRSVSKVKGISVAMNDATVDEVLDKILENTGLSYEISNSVVLIKDAANVVSKGLATKLKIPAVQDNITLTGTVTDENGSPLPGATVVEKGTNNGTITNTNGLFSLDVESANPVLIFSFVGFEQQEVAVGNRTSLNIQMQTSTRELEEAVVVGYGTTRRRDFTGSVSTISEQEIISKNVASSSSLLQNMAAGVSVSGSTGRPGEEVRIRVRGATSLTGDNEPLYVIDGVPSTVANVLSTIPPSDIVSIDVLKDASSSAIYGSRAANGVVMVTTKNGRLNQKTKFSFTYNASTDKQIKNFTLLDGDQFRSYLTDLANQTLVVDPGNTTATNILDPEGGYVRDANTNWFNEVKQAAWRQNYDMSFIGGSKNVAYFLSGSVMDQTGMVVGDDLTRYSGRINLDVFITDWFKIGTKTTLSYTDQNESGTSLFRAQGYRPDYPVFNEDGVTYYDTNPVAYSNVIDNSDSYRISGLLYGELEFFEGFKLRSSISANQSMGYNYSFSPSYLSYWGDASASRSENRSFNTVFDNTLNFNRTFAQVHAVDVVGGVSFENFESQSGYLSKTGFPMDEIYINVSAGNDYSSSSDSKMGRGLFSSFARVNYKYNDKYLGTLTGRYDGSSMFGKNNRYGFFPSAALAWRIKKEPFLESVAFISDLKLKVSAGKTGIQNLTSYSNRDLYEATHYNGQPGIRHSQIGNKDIQWELSTIYDAGIDFALFNFRLKGSLGYYQKNTEDLIWNLSFPSTMAVNSMMYNIGSVRNQGVEFSVNAAVIDKGDFKFDLSLNLASNNNEVTKLVEEGATENSSGAIVQGSFGQVLAEGYPMGSFLGYKYNGIIQDQARIDELNAMANENGFSTYNGTLYPGNLELSDLNSDGHIDTKDQTIIGTPDPDLFGGLSASVQYKRFSLMTNFGFQLGGEKLYGKALQNVPSQLVGLVDYNLYNRWSPDNKDATIPAIYLGQGVPANTDMSLFDASYFRLQDLRVAYDLPKINDFPLQGQVYFSASNLFTITSYPGTDPATVNTYGNYGGNYETSYPGLRTYSFGLKLTL